MAKWFEEALKEHSNIIYSRARLVRNWNAYPFPGKLTDDQMREMLFRMLDGLKDIGSLEQKTFLNLDLSGMSQLDRRALSERRVLNKSMIQKNAPCNLLLSDDETVSIVLNGEDHFRIQVIRSGLFPEECYEHADRLDDYIGERFPYAFDEKYGFLTAFPTNVGTGLRVSVVLHLPLLSSRKNFAGLAADMGRFGTSLRGVYGDGSENYGDLYEVSNQKTLGQSEKDIVDLVKKSALELNTQENRLRAELLRQNELGISDEIWKSYGVLKYARKLSYKDAMIFLSRLMEGMEEGILRPEKPCAVYKMMLGIQPANLLKLSDKALSKEEIEVARADFLRVVLPEIM